MEGDFMLSGFFPDEDYNSAYEIDYKKLYQDGYRGIIFDVDNTLVEHGAPAERRSIELFRALRAIGYKTILLSNNTEARVKIFKDRVGGGYIFKANKPSVKNYKKAMDMMGTNKNNTLFVGDQIFTDIWGAKRAGIRSLLVKPIHPKEEIQIVFKRQLEKVVLFFYRRKARR
jgi:uncharacterized protein